MKKTVLLSVMAILFTVMYAKAEWNPVKYRMSDPVKITVRGVDFFVFPNGEFDFNAHKRRYLKHHRFGVRIERDRTGKIRRIGNVFLNYNRYGQLKRIGNLFIRYNRRGLVSRIGNRKIRYRRHGYVVLDWDPPAYVSASSFYYGPASSYGATCSTSSTTFFESDDYYENDDYQDSDDNYYYRSSKHVKTTGRKRTK